MPPASVHSDSSLYYASVPLWLWLFVEDSRAAHLHWVSTLLAVPLKSEQINFHCVVTDILYPNDRQQLRIACWALEPGLYHTPS